MQKVLLAIVVAVTSGLLMGCGLSEEEIAQTVKASMQNTFDTNPEFKPFGLQVQSVMPVKEDANQYQGIAKVSHNGQVHDVVVKITADGEKVLWQTAPGAFLFTAQAQMQENLEALQAAFE